MKKTYIKPEMAVYKIAPVNMIAFSVKTSEEEESNDAIYTLQGTQVNQSYKGLVIKNGKKYIVK